MNVGIAINARDFSDPDFVEPTGMKTAQSFTDRLSEEVWVDGPEEWTRLGPEPYLVLDVISQSDKSSLILCGYAARDKPDSRDVFIYSVSVRPEKAATLTLESDPPSGAKSRDEYRAQCGAATIPVGYFDPAPEPQTDRNAKVKGPAAADKYNLD